MTPSEAVQQAVVNHEFRHYAPVPLNTPALPDDVDGVTYVCYCGTQGPPFLNEKRARDAHGRHQARLALMRSFGHWDT